MYSYTVRVQERAVYMANHRVARIPVCIANAACLQRATLTMWCACGVPVHVCAPTSSCYALTLS